MANTVYTDETFFPYIHYLISTAISPFLRRSSVTKTDKLTVCVLLKSRECLLNISGSVVLRTNNDTSMPLCAARIAVQLQEVDVHVDKIASYCEQLAIVNAQITIEFKVTKEKKKGTEENYTSSREYGSLSGTTLKVGAQQYFKCEDIGAATVKRKDHISIDLCVGFNSARIFSCNQTQELHMLVFAGWLDANQEVSSQLAQSVKRWPKWSEYGITLTSEMKHSEDRWTCDMKAESSLQNLCVVIHLSGLPETNGQNTPTLAVHEKTFRTVYSKAMRELQSRHQKTFKSLQQLKVVLSLCDSCANIRHQKEEMMQKCIPEVAQSIAAIVKRSTNKEFQQSALSHLGIESFDSIQERVIALMTEIALQPKTAKRKKEDVFEEARDEEIVQLKKGKTPPTDDSQPQKQSETPAPLQNAQSEDTQDFPDEEELLPWETEEQFYEDDYQQIIDESPRPNSMPWLQQDSVLQKPAFWQL